MLTRFLALIFLTTSLPLGAATTSWEGYGFKKCQHWAMTPDDFEGSGRRFDKARETAERANLTDDDNGWHVVQGEVLWEDDEPVYGVCRFESAATILSCSAQANFPLSGATYKKNRDADFVCIRGCDKTDVKMIIEMAYEEKTVFSASAERLRRRFESSCHDDAKREKFLQRLHKK